MKCQQWSRRPKQTKKTGITRIFKNAEDENRNNNSSNVVEDYMDPYWLSIFLQQIGPLTWSRIAEGGGGPLYPKWVWQTVSQWILPFSYARNLGSPVRGYWNALHNNTQCTSYKEMQTIDLQSKQSMSQKQSNKWQRSKWIGTEKLKTQK